MRPVFQKRNNPTNGDCMIACIASIMEVELEELPDPNRSGPIADEDFNAAIQDWLSRRDMQLIELDCPLGLVPPCRTSHAIMTGATKRGHRHAVVCAVSPAGVVDIVHDPARRSLSRSPFPSGPERIAFIVKA